MSVGEGPSESMVDVDALPTWPLEKADPMLPPPELASLRAGCPMSKVKLWDGRPTWLATHHEDVRSLLADSNISSDVSRQNYPHQSATAAAMRSDQQGSFIRMDPPKHTEQRSMVASYFRVRRIKEFEPFVHALIESLTDEMEAGERPVDLVTQFAQRVPAIVTARLLAMPFEDGDFLQEKVIAVMSDSGSPADVMRASADIREYLGGIVDSRFERPGDDMVSELIRDHVVPGQLTRTQLIDILLLLLIGGFDTTANMISTGTLMYFRNPEQLAKLLERPELGPRAAEELLRYVTPTQRSQLRMASGEIDIAGVQIRPGDAVLASLYAANHDPDVFEAPERFDVERDARRHVAFGYGPHQCIGQHLARLELRAVFPRLFQRLPGLRLACDEKDLTFRHSGIFGLEKLPVTW
jgi:cytochrome P450